MNDADPVLAALDDLVGVGRDNVSMWMGVMARVDVIRELRRQGVAYTNMDIDAGIPIVEAISSAQERLTTAAAKFRRATVHELHKEGMSAAAIARIFGVSRQRIANLLAGEDQGGACNRG